MELETHCYIVCGNYAKGAGILEYHFDLICFGQSQLRDLQIQASGIFFSLSRFLKIIT